jgi:hypothetical protein
MYFSLVGEPGVQPHHVISPEISVPVAGAAVASVVAAAGSVVAAAGSVVAAGALLAQPANSMDIVRARANTTANVFFMIILLLFYLFAFQRIYRINGFRIWDAL